MKKNISVSLLALSGCWRTFVFRAPRKNDDISTTNVTELAPLIQQLPHQGDRLISECKHCGASLQDCKSEYLFGITSRKMSPFNKSLKRGREEPPSTVAKKARMDPLMSCSRMLKELLSKRHRGYAWRFYGPIDAVTLGLPECDLIEEPMDLDTIKNKMDQQQYSNITEFAADMRLMFSNCEKHVPSSHQMFYNGKKLQEVFEERYSKLYAAQLADLNEQVNAIEQQLERIYEELGIQRKKERRENSAPSGDVRAVLVKAPEPPQGPPTKAPPTLLEQRAALGRSSSIPDLTAIMSSMVFPVLAPVKSKKPLKDVPILPQKKKSVTVKGEIRGRKEVDERQQTEVVIKIRLVEGAPDLLAEFRSQVNWNFE